MRGLWKLRLWAKNLWCRFGLGSTLIEYCQACGIKQPLVWWSPTDLWTDLTGYEPYKGECAGGIYCPRCYDALARKRGLLLQWHPTVLR